MRSWIVHFLVSHDLLEIILIWRFKKYLLLLSMLKTVSYFRGNILWVFGEQKVQKNNIYLKKKSFVILQMYVLSHLMCPFKMKVLISLKWTINRSKANREDNLRLFWDNRSSESKSPDRVCILRWPRRKLSDCPITSSLEDTYTGVWDKTVPQNKK